MDWNALGYKVVRAIYFFIFSLLGLLALIEGSFVGCIIAAIGFVVSIKSVSDRVFRGNQNIGFAIAFALMLIAVSFISNKKKEEKKQLTVEETIDSLNVMPKDSLTKAEQLVLKKEQFNECLDKYTHSCNALVDRVKTKLKKPKSFEHIETTYLFDPADENFAVVMRYSIKKGKEQMIKAKVTANCELLSVEEL